MGSCSKKLRLDFLPDCRFVAYMTASKDNPHSMEIVSKLFFLITAKLEDGAWHAANAQCASLNASAASKRAEDMRDLGEEIMILAGAIVTICEV